jgi:hypothetical protein
MCAAIHFQIQYLARKTNELFERQMKEAAKKICERQQFFAHLAS